MFLPLPSRRRMVRHLREKKRQTGFGSKDIGLSTGERQEDQVNKSRGGAHSHSPSCRSRLACKPISLTFPSNYWICGQWGWKEKSWALSTPTLILSSRGEMHTVCPTLCLQNHHWRNYSGICQGLILVWFEKIKENNSISESVTAKAYQMFLMCKALF